MFARRKQNKNGTTSVQVIDKSHKSYRVVKSFGVGHSEAEIYRLEEKARQYILERQGLANGLFEDEDEMKLETFLSSLSNSQLQVIGPELIFGTLYDRIGYGQISNTMFRHLVITRLFSHDSKLKRSITWCDIRVSHMTSVRFPEHGQRATELYEIVMKRDIL